MQLKSIRRTFRKRIKAQQKSVENFGAFTEQSIERNVFKRFTRLAKVRRFVFGWVLLMVLIIGTLIAQFQHLSSYYQTVQAIDGGIYSEGMVGSISNVNPLYATSDVDRSISRLLFAGLLGYDVNGELQPSLAEKYEVGENGRTYTVTLKPNLVWHDGQPLTAADAAFTFNTIKKADARSPLFATWQNVTVSTPNERTVVFRLPSPLASFPYSLTTGLVPEHVLASVAPGSLRSTEFNTVKPVGAGPFSWRGLEVTGDTVSELQEQVALLPFDKYVGGTPKLSEFIVRVYGSRERLEQAFASGQLTAAAGLDAIPAGSPKSAEEQSLILKGGTYVFFKTTQPTLASVKVRQALVAASNPTAIIDKLGYMTRPVVGPLLSNQLGFDKRYAQKTNDPATAKRLLAEDGWVVGANGTLAKNNKPLSFRLVIADTPEYRMAAKQLTDSWQAVGVKAEVSILPIADYATALSNHDYDATMHGISIGTDPDVYAYWHSSQADIRSTNRLNISEWKNTTADQALEAGRTRTDGQLRTVKYAPFLQAWQQEAPALGLYQPRSLYITRSQVFGLTTQSITSNIDRYNGVQDWRIRSAKVSD